MLCPSGIDPLVFAELPQEIQQELMEQASIKEKGSSSKALKQRCLSFAAASTTVPLSQRSITTSVNSSAPNTLKQQHLTFGSASNIEEEFIDVDFPALPESIDGRKVTGTSSAPRRCKCGKVCRVRKVSKDGINHGRFFESCGNAGGSDIWKEHCDYFSWADNAPHESKTSSLQWKRFRSSAGWSLFGSKNGFSSDDIRQGGVGDCWFLSAVSTICLRQDLIQAIVCDPSPTLRIDGQASFRLFLDGHWRDIVVDTQLPCLGNNSSSSSSKTIKQTKAAELPLAYSRPGPQGHLWVCLLEKAYAKAHGSYHAISGGWTSEAMFNLTGAPTSEHDFSAHDFNSEALWECLVSCKESQFPMCCDTGGQHGRAEGIVGGHAYSILDVKEIADVTLGGHLKLEEYYQMSSSSSSSSSADVGATGSNSTTGRVIDLTTDDLPDHNGHEPWPAAKKRRHNAASSSSSLVTYAQKVTDLLTETGSLRVLRIRNPWGRFEWQGDLGSNSDVWTSKLSRLLDKGSKDDGTFWMTYHDFLRRFGRVDVCKARRREEGWISVSYDCRLRTSPIPARAGVTDGGGMGGDQRHYHPLDICTESYFTTTVTSAPTQEYTQIQTTAQTHSSTSALSSSHVSPRASSVWCHFTLVQPTKRGKFLSSRDRQYWYSALSLVVLRVLPAAGTATADKHDGGKEEGRTSVMTKPRPSHLGMEVVAASFMGAQGRTCSPSVEMLLSPGRYVVVPLHFAGGRKTTTRGGASATATSSSTSSSSSPPSSSSSSSPSSSSSSSLGESFVLHVYSAASLPMETHRHPSGLRLGQGQKHGILAEEITQGRGLAQGQRLGSLEDDGYVTGHALALILHPYKHTSLRWTNLHRQKSLSCRVLPIASTAVTAIACAGATAGTILDVDTTSMVVEERREEGDVVVEERRGGVVMDMTGDSDNDADNRSASSSNVHLYVHRGGGGDDDEVVFVTAVNESKEAVTCRVDMTACNYFLTSPFVVTNTSAAASAAASLSSASSSSFYSSSSSSSTTKPPTVVRVLVTLPPLSYRLVGILVSTALDQGLPPAPALALAPVPAPCAYTWVIGGNGGGSGLPPSLVPSAIPSDQQILGFSSFSASPRSGGSANGTTPSLDTFTNVNTINQKNQQQQQKLVLPHFDPHTLH